MESLQLKYSQPDFYHFSEWSPWLVKNACEHCQSKVFSALDLGAGCGVVGIELALVRPELKDLYLCELNTAFASSIEENTKKLAEHRPDLSIKSYLCDWKKIDQNIRKVDLILSNPPFYLDEEGRKSPHDDKNTCHFWKEENLIFWLQAISTSLSNEGQCFFVMKKPTRRHEKLLRCEGENKGLRLELVKREGPVVLFLFTRVLNIK